MSEYTLKQKFPTLDTNACLNKYGIKLHNDNFLFSDINIVTGANGCGKTRFLLAVKEMYQNSEKKAIYGYFPSLSETSIHHEISDVSMPEISLYESIEDSEADFDNFLQEIEIRGIDFIYDLLNYKSHKSQKKNEIILISINDCLKKLSGYELTFGEDKKLLIKKDGEEQLLKVKLTEFSPGELMLFYIALFLAIQENNNHSRVVILDEPECHLHPKAMITFINALKDCKKIDTLWIATYSLFVVPEYKFENLILIKKNTVQKRNSSTYREIYESLLGNNENINQFFASLSQWQICEYITECFKTPNVIGTININDPQIKLFFEFIKTFDVTKPLRILDYGGGKARLGKSIYSFYGLGTKIIYEIFDTKMCDEGKAFIWYDDIKKINEKYYDCVVLMNVLHEIEPNKWITIFNQIDHILKDNGYILFVEQHVLHTGESAHKYGYFVLTENELRILFNNNSLSNIKFNDKTTTTCVPINKSLLSNITIELVNKAIRNLQIMALERVKTYRSYSEYELKAREYAFWSQQYINATIYLDELSHTKSNQQNSTLTLDDRYIPKGSIGKICLDDSTIQGIPLSIYKPNLNPKVTKTKRTITPTNSAKDEIEPPRPKARPTKK